MLVSEILTLHFQSSKHFFDDHSLETKWIHGDALGMLFGPRNIVVHLQSPLQMLRSNLVISRSSQLDCGYWKSFQWIPSLSRLSIQSDSHLGERTSLNGY